MKWLSRRYTNKGGADQNEQAQQDFYKTLTSNYNSDFGQFEGLTKGLQAKLQPIIDAGPGQYGFDATEDAALRGAATNSDAAAAQNAQEATNRQITAQNGGADLMPSGAQEELREQGNVTAAQKLASDQNTITAEGYQTGQQNYQNALSGEMSIARLEDPNSWAGSATSGGNAATNATNTAIQADNGWMNMVGGALGGAASIFSGAGTAAIFGGKK